jgi:hypothetical protein
MSDGLALQRKTNRIVERSSLPQSPSPKRAEVMAGNTLPFRRRNAQDLITRSPANCAASDAENKSPLCPKPAKLLEFLPDHTDHVDAHGPVPCLYNHNGSRREGTGHHKRILPSEIHFMSSRSDVIPTLRCLGHWRRPSQRRNTRHHLSLLIGRIKMTKVADNSKQKRPKGLS